MSHGTLADVLVAAARRMRADFEMSSPIGHSGSKGSTRELELLSFLRRNLPRSLEVSGSSEIVDSEGNTSGQIDIVVHDPSIAPLYNSGNYQILPAEAVHLVVEVKSKLDLKELRNSLETISSAKRLRKLSYHKEVDEREKERKGEALPIFGYVFAYDSVNLHGLYSKAKMELSYYPASLRPDAVWVLGIGAYNWADLRTGQIQSVANERSLLSVGDIDPQVDVLMNMMLILNSALSDVHVPKFDIRPYVKNAPVLRNVTQEGPILQNSRAASTESRLSLEPKRRSK